MEKKEVKEMIKSFDVELLTNLNASINQIETAQITCEAFGLSRSVKELEIVKKTLRQVEQDIYNIQFKIQKK